MMEDLVAALVSFAFAAMIPFFLPWWISLLFAIEGLIFLRRWWRGAA